jgi:hypothetical protein
MKRVLLLLCGWLLCLAAHAHKPSDSYLTLDIAGERVEGQWDIALRDLDFAIGLDTDRDGAITWGEVRARHNDIAAYALARLRLSSEGKACPAKVGAHLIDQHTDGAYAVMRFDAQCGAPIQVLEANYSLFHDIDPQHKGLLRLQYKGVSSSAIFTPEKPVQQFALAAPDRLSQFVDYVREGVWHIWIGFDHILFLLALLLPAVVERKAGQWRAVTAFKPALWDVFKIVTAFTLAHSITLSLAALQIVSLPSRLVESTIAASVVLAALNNLYPLFAERRWTMAFAFGLIHGFGFATVLGDLGLPQGALVLSLVGFNVGVELGQLAIVGIFIPIAFALRGTWFYRRLVLAAGSALIALLASAWFIERAFNLKLLPV